MDIQNELLKLAKLSPTQKILFLLVILLLTIFLGFTLLTSSVISEIKDLEVKEQELKASYRDKQSKALNLQEYKLQLSNIKSTFKTLLNQLPDKSQMDKLLNDINNVGTNNGLQFDEFVPKEEEKKDFYAIAPISIKINSDYNQLGKFSEQLSLLPRIVNIDDFVLIKESLQNNNINKNPNLKIINNSNNTKLILSSTIKTYRYLDEEEIRVLKELEKANKKKKRNN